MSQIKTVWKWGCTQVLQRMLCTISVTVHFLLSILSASPQTTLDAGISAGIRRSELSGDVHMGPEYQAWLPYVLLSLSLPRATCWHWKNRDDTSEMGIFCAIWPIGNTKDMALQPISGMHRERQDSGSAGEQWWSCFYHHLGSGCSVWQ